VTLMRKVVYGGAISLDGYLARDDGSVDWIIHSRDAMRILKDMWSRFDVMVMGRKTFTTAMQNFSEEDLKKAAEMTSGIRSIVFSRTLECGTRGPYEIVNADATQFVGDLKQQPGKDIMLMGGGELARSMLEAELIDEIGLNIQPLLLGSGIPTFPRMSKQIDLEMMEARPLDGGCVYATYNVKN
jgi:dihydrofolate reductase